MILIREIRGPGPLGMGKARNDTWFVVWRTLNILNFILMGMPIRIAPARQYPQGVATAFKEATLDVLVHALLT
jgi:hypothetical protein